MSEETKTCNTDAIVREMQSGHRAASNRASWALAGVLVAVFVYVCQPGQWVGSPVPDFKCVTVQTHATESFDAALEDSLRQHPRMRVETAVMTTQGLVVCYRSEFNR